MDDGSSEGEEKKDGGVLGGRLMTRTTTLMTTARRVLAVRWLMSTEMTAQSGACWRCITSDSSRQQYTS